MKTVIFDVDDTLYDQILPFKKAVQSFFDRSFTDEELNQFYISNRKFSDELFHQSAAGEIPLEQLHIYRITEAAKLFGITLSSTEALLFQEKYLQEQHNIHLFLETEQLINYLHEQNVQLAVLTNGEKAHQMMKIKQLQLDRWIPEEHLFISGALGMAKPSKQVFTHIEQQLALDKAQTFYIGDSFDHDIIGAKQVGWKAIWMNHRRRKAPDTVISADFEVQHPGELLKLFQQH